MLGAAIYFKEAKNSATSGTAKKAATSKNGAVRAGMRESISTGRTKENLKTGANSALEEKSIILAITFLSGFYTATITLFRSLKTANAHSRVCICIGSGADKCYRRNGF